MKKFSEKIKENKRINSKDKIENEIINVLEDLNIKISGKDSEKLLIADIDIKGKEKILEKLKTLINDVRIQERKNTLNFVKSNSFKNFNMSWLNEQINGLNKIKIGNEIVLNEKLSNSSLTNEYRAALKEYFATNLNGENINDWNFDFDEKSGVFDFTHENGVSVKATPFWNSPDKVTFEIQLEGKKMQEETVDLNVEQIIYEEYLEKLKSVLDMAHRRGAYHKVLRPAK